MLTFGLLTHLFQIKSVNKVGGTLSPAEPVHVMLARPELAV